MSDYFPLQRRAFALSLFSAAVPIGAQAARDMLMTPRRVDGREALAIGLADRLVEPETLDDEALAFASMIAANAPLALGTVRGALSGVDGVAARAATAAEVRAQAVLFQTADFREGVAAAERTVRASSYFCPQHGFHLPREISILIFAPNSCCRHPAVTPRSHRRPIWRNSAEIE